MKQINYYNTPDERRNKGDFYVKIMSFLTGGKRNKEPIKDTLKEIKAKVLELQEDNEKADDWGIPNKDFIFVSLEDILNKINKIIQKI